MEGGISGLVFIAALVFFCLWWDRREKGEMEYSIQQVKMFFDLMHAESEEKRRALMQYALEHGLAIAEDREGVWRATYLNASEEEKECMMQALQATWGKDNPTRALVAYIETYFIYRAHLKLDS